MKRKETRKQDTHKARIIPTGCLEEVGGELGFQGGTGFREAEGGLRRGHPK